MLEELSENQKEKYASFWKEFGRVMKEQKVVYTVCTLVVSLYQF